MWHKERLNVLSRDMEDIEKILLGLLEMKTIIFKLKDTLLEISRKWKLQKRWLLKTKHLKLPKVKHKEKKDWTQKELWDFGWPKKYAVDVLKEVMQD